MICAICFDRGYYTVPAKWNISITEVSNTVPDNNQDLPTRKVYCTCQMGQKASYVEWGKNNIKTEEDLLGTLSWKDTRVLVGGKDIPITKNVGHIQDFISYLITSSQRLKLSVVFQTCVGDFEILWYRVGDPIVGEIRTKIIPLS